MIIAYDSSILCLMLQPEAIPTPDPETGEPAKYCKQRIEALIDNLDSRGGELIVPTPSLAEVLTAVPDIAKAFELINKSSVINLAPFDARSAIELALWTKHEIERGNKKGGSAEAWQKVKFDRQIASIAKANGAVEFYSDDQNQTIFVNTLGMTVKHSWNLPIPQNMGDLFDEQK